jgi:ribosome biogenesis protein MAK21
VCIVQSAYESVRLFNHIDTLFRITHSSNFNTSIQALILIQQLTVTHQFSADRFYRTLYESLLDPRLTTSSKHALYLNLLYKALKSDLNMMRVTAFIKRIVQILGLHQPSFVCGVFFMIHELGKAFSSLETLIDEPQVDDSDEEEVFKDVPDEEDHQQDGAAQTSGLEPQRLANGYDPRKRDPQHCNADKSCLWELVSLDIPVHLSANVSGRS